MPLSSMTLKNIVTLKSKLGVIKSLGYCMIIRTIRSIMDNFILVCRCKYSSLVKGPTLNEREL